MCPSSHSWTLAVGAGAQLSAFSSLKKWLRRCKCQNRQTRRCRTQTGGCQGLGEGNEEHPSGGMKMF